MSRLLFFIVFIFYYPTALADWFFRGTPNQWTTTEMNASDTNIRSICVFFENGDSAGGPRFKIDRYGDWQEAYPSSDYQVDSNSFYQIQFHVSNTSLEVQKRDSCDSEPPEDTWFYRGTSNGWGTTVMNPVNDSGSAPLYEITVAFNGEDSNARFKIDHFGDWSENYPQQDFVVDDFSEYRITFNAQSKEITTHRLDGGDDTQAPSVTSLPAAGLFRDNQSIRLEINDNLDSNPRLFYTTDGQRPSRRSTEYNGESLSAIDQVSSGSDLTIRTLAVDDSGNERLQTFDFIIDPLSSTQTDFREETIYFVLTARFYDGDSSNNYYNRDRYEEGDPHWRGDFKGLIQHLDYIKDLGFTAIWITPPVENRSGLDYHGYHAYDWNRIDPRLESADATYQDFINAAHDLGLKVIQDVVINHSSQYGIRDQVWIDHLPIKYYVPQGSSQGLIDNGLYQRNLGDYLSAFRDDNDNSVAPNWFRERHGSDPDGIVPLVDPKTGVTVPSPGYDPNRFFGIDAQGLDPNWYHLDGFMAGGDWENPTSLFRKHLAGDTIDLATDRSNVQNYLNSAIRQYLDMGVDAIRLDTAKHMERDELLTYVHNWQQHKPGLFVFGEVLVKGLGFGSELGNDNGPAQIRPWWYTRTGSNATQPSGDSNLSVLDFPLFSTFRDNVTRGSLSGIGGALSWDWTYADPTQLVTFFQNHDVGPDNDFKFRFCCEESNAALAYNLLWTIRGIPTLYYGEEIMFKAGAPQDIASNNDKVSQTGRAYFGEHLDNRQATQSHNLYQHIKRLNHIRHAVPALQKGVMEHINEWGSGMSFVRNDQHSGSYAVVGLATHSPQSITVTGVKNGTYRDAISGRTVTTSRWLFEV